MFPRLHFSIERWRKNTEFGVWVSNHGRVRLIKNKKYLEPRINPKGYCIVFTEKGAVLVHRLVAYTWLGDRRNEKYTIDHINSNKRDNRVSNLRLVSEKINTDYAKFTECSNEEVKETVPDTSIEEDETKLEKMYDTGIAKAKRASTFRKAFLDKKIKVFYDGQLHFNNNEITTFEDLYKVKTYYKVSITNDEFINRILMSVRGNKAYCNGTWTIQVV